LQDLDRAVVIGERTYGKGLVQQTRDLYYNSKLKVTVAKYYIPSGRCIQKLDYAQRDSSGKVQEVKEAPSPNSRRATDDRFSMDAASYPTWPCRILIWPRWWAACTARTSSSISPPVPARPRGDRTLPRILPISDALYREFVDFVKDEQFDYDTESLRRVQDELEEKAKKERYYDHAKAQIEALRMNWHRTAQKNWCASARTSRRCCVTRSYRATTSRRAGPRRASSTDPYILKGLEILNNGSYGTILAGK
jgi:carboxyl-terminal processing protease